MKILNQSKNFIILGFALITTASGLCLAGPDHDELFGSRKDMVEKTIRSRGVSDPKVLAAMTNVKRHLFVNEALQNAAYSDRPLPIGYGQTISQPYIVAVMTEYLDLQDGGKILEIGTGSGYQAAVLAELAGDIFTVEIIKELGKSAESRFKEQGYENIYVKIGDGYYGWEEHAPYDGIVVTAAATHIPPPLIDQLKPGGKMVIPVGPVFQIQQLILLEKQKDGSVTQRSLMPVAFVPLVRE